MKLTKKDMVKVILKALWHRNEIPEMDIWRIRINRLMRWKKEELQSQYDLANTILKAREQK